MKYHTLEKLRKTKTKLDRALISEIRGDERKGEPPVSESGCELAMLKDSISRGLILTVELSKKISLAHQLDGVQPFQTLLFLKL